MLHWNFLDTPTNPLDAPQESLNTLLDAPEILRRPLRRLPIPSTSLPALAGERRPQGRLAEVPELRLPSLVAGLGALHRTSRRRGPVNAILGPVCPEVLPEPLVGF